jgi:hypothetical protein
MDDETHGKTHEIFGISTSKQRIVLIHYLSNYSLFFTSK